MQFAIYIYLKQLILIGPNQETIREINDDFKDSVFDVDKVIGSYWASSDFLCYTQIFIVLIAGIFLLIIMP